jgi:hypothetical protein
MIFSNVNASRLRLLVLLLLLIERGCRTVLALQQTTQAARIQVCQNKACCQRWNLKTPLPDVLLDLVYDGDRSKIVIDTTSCLGQCDLGPNLRIVKDPNLPDVNVNGINDVIGLVSVIEDILAISVTSKRLAAVNVFEKALTGTHSESCLRAMLCVYDFILASIVCFRSVCIENRMASFYRVANNCTTSIILFGAIWSRK